MPALSDQDKVFRNLTCKRVQCDEIWSFIGANEKNATADKKAQGWGDVWTWTALDAETKLVPCWYVGTRDGGAEYHFIHDLAGRLAHRVQLTTDGHKAYLDAVEDAFGADIDCSVPKGQTTIAQRFNVGTQSPPPLRHNRPHP